MSWALLAGSMAGVLGLALLAKLLGLGGGELADEAEAMRNPEAEIPGLLAVSADLAEDRRSALVKGADGSRIKVRQHGAQFVAEPDRARSSRS
jgi:hypothetical protein